MAFPWPRTKSRSSSSKTLRRKPFKRVLAFEIAEQRLMMAVDYIQVADALDLQLTTMQSKITAALNVLQTGPTSSIPFLGDKLGNAAQLVTSFSDELHAGLSDLGTNTTPTDDQIKTALSTRLNTFLAGAGLTGVQVSHADGATTVEMLLQGSIDNSDVSINFDTGLPSLPVKLIGVGAVELDFGYAFDLSFTINASGSVILNGGDSISGVNPPDSNHPIVDANNPLAIFVSASLSSDFQATSIFGFVQGTATTIPQARNAIYATALLSNLKGTPSVRLDGGAEVNLRLNGSFAGTNDDFPGISTDFHLQWSLSSAEPTLNPPSVSFDNVSLSFGQFLSNVLTPVFGTIQDVTKPLDPVLDFLAAEIPGATDLSKAAGLGPITVGGLATLGAEVVGAGPLADLVVKVAKVLDKINSLQLGNNIRLPLGGFNLNSPVNGDLRAVAKSGNISDLSLNSITSLVAAGVQTGAQAYQDFVNDLPIDQDEKDMLNSLVAIPSNGFQIAFPILDDPAQAVFNLILGRDSDLFYLKADADVDLEGSQATGLSVFGLPINFVGRADVDMHFKFAYDTFGLRQLINNLAAGDTSHIFSDITDGFYINSDSYFRVAGGIGAEAGASVGLFDFVVGGGMFTEDHGEVPVSVSIIDPNSDGKLRISEFDNDRAFITSGQVDASLGVEVRLGKEILGKFFGIRKRFDIASAVLIEFGDPTPPVIASQPDSNGKVTLYLGQNAGLRTGIGLDQIDGDESFTIAHLGVHPNGGENIRVSAFGVSQSLENVRSIEAFDVLGELAINVLPGVTSDVNFVGGQGAANLFYRGTGSASLHGGAIASTLSGGNGTNFLIGGSADDTIILGSGANTVDGGSGQNTIVIEAPIFQSAIVSGGSNPDNKLQIFGSPNTVEISAFPVGNVIDLGIHNKLEDPVVHLQLSNIGDVFVSAQDSIANYRFGDLSAAGVTDMILSMTSSFPVVRSMELDSRVANGPSSVAFHPLVNVYDDPQHVGETITEHGVTIVNSTTGLNVQILGLQSRDTLTYLHHGGSIDVDPLGLTSGKFVFDTSLRSSGSHSDAITITTPPRVDAHLVMTNAADDVLMTYTDYPSFRIQGDTPLDILNINVAAPSSGANQIDISASRVKGALNLRMLGSASAINHIQLSDAGPHAKVSIYGQSTTSDLLFGTGKLASIQNDVFASHVQLRIDNDEATEANRLFLGETSFGSWIVPTLAGVTPKLTFANLHGPMKIYAGAGDRFQLDATPLSITELTMFNSWKQSQDQVYTSNWSVPLKLNGNFAFFAGQRLRNDGSVERVKRLNQVGVSVTLNFEGDDPTQVVLDGDLDPAGAQYILDAVPAKEGPPSDPAHFRIQNQTVSLQVKFYGSRDVDSMYVYMSGATVHSDLQAEVAGTITFDGRARLEGNHATSPNDITIMEPAGTITMVPVATNDSLLTAFNKVYVLGAMPQDRLNVTAPTTFKVAPTDLGTGPTSWSVSHPLGGLFAPAIAVNPPTDVFVVETYEFDYAITTGFAVRFPLLEGPNGSRDQVLASEESEFAVVLANHPLVPVGKAKIRRFPSNPNPTPINNEVTLNASQLRGSFSFTTAEPDYGYAKMIVDALSDEGSYFINSKPIVNFGQANINLTHTNPELVTDLTGTQPISPAMYNALTATGYRSIGRFPGTKIQVGNGTLANVQGNVNVDQAWLYEIDNRNGVDPNTIGSSATTLSWTSNSGDLVSLSMSHLQGDLTLSGSPFDAFNITGTPNSATKFSVRNFSDTLIPAEVYLTGKSVMPLDISGNFNLTVGRSLNANGTTTTGGILSGISRGNRYTPTGAMTAAGLWRNFGFVSQYSTLFEPISNSGSLPFEPYNYLSATSHQIVLPITFNYSGPATSKFVFDASNETYNVTGGQFFASAGGFNGVSSNEYYPGKADLSFLGTHVLYGTNTEVFLHGPRLTTGVNQPNPGFPVLLDNPNSKPVHYIANPNNVNPSLMELVLVGKAVGPIFVTGNGKATRVEVNPLFSLPHRDFQQVSSPDVSTQGFPGWGSGHTGGTSLIDTILSDITVSNAALRVIADLPTSAGVPRYADRPNVTLTQDELQGIAGGTIHFSNLFDSNNSTAANTYDMGMKQMPGLSIQLPSSLTSTTTIADTPASITTVISTIRAPQELQHTSGPITVLGTTGVLSLSPYALGNELRFFWAGLTNAANNNINWFDSLCVPQVTIGDHGSLSAIHGPILIDPDFRSTSPTVYTIDGKTDPSRSNVVFSALTNTDQFNFSTQNSLPSGLSLPQMQLVGMAPAPIMFSGRFHEARPVNVLGSAGSNYKVLGRTGAPAGLKLTTGADGVVFSEGWPQSIIGATSIELSLTGGNNIPRTENRIQQDPAHPQPISLQIKSQQIDTGFGNNFLDRLTGTTFQFARGSGTQSGNSDYFRVLYDGDVTTVSVDYVSSMVVNDTGAAGTTIGTGNRTIQVNGTTGPLQIKPLEYSGNPSVTLGNGNTQGLNGTIGIIQDTNASQVLSVRMNDSTYSVARSTTLDRPQADRYTISGLSSVPISITGSNVELSLAGGTASNTLTSNLPLSSWVIDAANAGNLNRSISFTGMRNLVSGAGDDQFLLKTNGSIAGNIDGGAGVDTIKYLAGMLGPADTINLPNQIAPRVAGQARNLETSGTFNPLALTKPANFEVQYNSQMNPVAIVSTGGVGTKTFKATGLPEGIQIHPQTGVISGKSTIEQYFAQVTITVTDDTGTASTTALYTALPGLILTHPGNRSSQVTEEISLQMQVSYTYTGTLTYTANRLPPGLSINSQTGLISGTIADGAQLSSPYNTEVRVTDGPHLALHSFSWFVQKSFAVLNPGNQVTPDTVPVNLKMKVLNSVGPVSYSASGLPSGLSINSQTGIISGAIANYWYFYHQNFTFNVTVFATDSQKTTNTSFTWQTLPGFTPTGVNNRSNLVGDEVSFPILATDFLNGGAFTYTVENLPPGITYDPTTKIASGKLGNFADVGGPYRPKVTFTNTLYSYSYPMTFEWQVLPTVILTSPGAQSSHVGDVVDLAIAIERDFGSPLTFSATGLPAGLSIDPATGRITGTVENQLASPFDAFVQVSATDGVNSGYLSLSWLVESAQPNVAVLAEPIHGGTITITSPVGTKLTASYSNQFVDGETGIQLPDGFPFKFLNLTVEGLVPGSAALLTISPSSHYDWETLYLQEQNSTNRNGWSQFLYQTQTDASDASTTGAEFLPNGDIVLHLVDGARGDFGLDATDGTIYLVDVGPSTRIQRSTFTVNSLDDTPDANPGDGIAADSAGKTTLRAAIQEANTVFNSQFESDLISFDLPGAGPFKLVVTSALPPLADGVVIDARSVGGFATTGIPGLQISGEAISIAGTNIDGLRIRSSNSEILGLSITDFSGDGIEVANTTDAYISSNYLGIDPTGAAKGNRGYGLRINNSQRSLFDSNVISGNSLGGVSLAGTAPESGSMENVFTRNMIGVDATGMNAIPNLLDGIVVDAPYNTIGKPGLGNVISGNNSNGINLSVNAYQTTIQGNQIGTNALGDSAIANGIHGIWVRSSQNRIGGNSTIQEGNLISGNGIHGVVLTGPSANENLIAGNRIGTNTGGTAAIPNVTSGITLMSGKYNYIGLATEGFGNLVSGNGTSGIVLAGGGTSLNQVAGNIVGATLDGMSPLGNGGYGISIRSGSLSNTVRGNQISGNINSGIALLDPFTRNNQISGNMIGTKANGTELLGNGLCAIVVTAPSNLIGGPNPEDSNIIAGSTRGIAFYTADATRNVVTGNYIGTDANETVAMGMATGVQFATGAFGNQVGPNNVIANNATGVRSLSGSGVGNPITANSIYGSSIIGIDLGNAGPTTNDVDDVDDGPNRLQNYPVLTSAKMVNTNLRIQYSVPSATANSAYSVLVQFFVSNSTGQGRRYLGARNYTAADFASGMKTITIAVSGIQAGDFLTATATDAAGNTSEFGLPIAIDTGAPAGLRAAAATRSTLDVSLDGSISPLDALMIINNLNQQNAAGETDTKSFEKGSMDVNGDGRISPLDALLVINWLNLNKSGSADLALQKTPEILSDSLIASELAVGTNETELSALLVDEYFRKVFGEEEAV